MSAAALFVVTMYAVGCDVKEGHPTKAGTLPVVGFTVAADPAVLPLGTIIHIEGLGERMVHDVGGKVKGWHLDVFAGSCRGAREWGRRTRAVRVLHWGGVSDGRRDAARVGPVPAPRGPDGGTDGAARGIPGQ